MVCLHPKIAYQRKFYPINANSTEEKLKSYNRISFKPKKGWKQIELPCGECPACRLQKANEWAVRLQCESETWHNKGIFVTLTYNNKNLPTNEDGTPTLVKKHIQLFKKRLRKYIKKNKEAFYSWENPKTGKIEYPIRTFECGEYGPKKGRPHYHQLIFNWEPKDLKLKKVSEDGYPLFTSKTLQEIWGNGFVIIGKISYESASYTARYTMKKAGLAKTKRKYFTKEVIDKITGEIRPKTSWKTIKGKIEPEFITMSTSTGLGGKYFIDNFEKIKKNNGILINVKGKVQLKTIPRYFRKLWEKKDWEDYEKWKYKNSQIAKNNELEKLKTYNLPDEWHIIKKMTFMRNQQIEIQKNKLNIMIKRDRIDTDLDDDSNIIIHNRYGAMEGARSCA